MTSSEFNKKWERYLKLGHYGLAIDVPDVVDYLDRTFEELHDLPGFGYSQIKMKFRWARAYMTGISPDKASDIEATIEELIKNGHHNP